METSIYPGGELSTWLLFMSHKTNIHSCVPPTMSATVNVCNTFVRLSSNYPIKCTLKIPISALQNKMDLISFAKWQVKGTVYINDLFNKEMLK